jgi:hypothetical protein
MSLYTLQQRKVLLSKKRGLYTYVDTKAFVGFPLKEAYRIIYSEFICPPANAKVSQLLFLSGNLMYRFLVVR